MLHLFDINKTASQTKHASLLLAHSNLFTYLSTYRMARVYDLEQLIDPMLIGCDKARITLEVRSSYQPDFD